eukprot:sb/3471320/
MLPLFLVLIIVHYSSPETTNKAPEYPTTLVTEDLYVRRRPAFNTEPEDVGDATDWPATVTIGATPSPVGNEDAALTSGDTPPVALTGDLEGKDGGAGDLDGGDSNSTMDDGSDQSEAGSSSSENKTRAPTDSPLTTVNKTEGGGQVAMVTTEQKVEPKVTSGGDPKVTSGDSVGFVPTATLYFRVS